MLKEIQLPSLGEGIDTAEVSDVLISPGDRVVKDDIVIVLESDKATMEVPATQTGIVSKVFISTGDSIKPGDNILSVDVEGESDAADQQEKTIEPAKVDKEPVAVPEEEIVSEAPVSKPLKIEKRIETIHLPDLGEGIESADVSEILVKAGDVIKKDDPILVLESDKATMEVPSEYNGTVKRVLLTAGESAGSGTPVLTIETEDGAASQEIPKAAKSETAAGTPTPKELEKTTPPLSVEMPSYMPLDAPNKKPLASPGVRRFSRELGADIAWIRGTGEKNRITKEDVQSYVKTQLAKAKLGAGPPVPQGPTIDFTQWGEAEESPLSRIRKITAQRMQEAWQTIPHVTQFDTANISGLETFRKALKAEAEKKEIKITPLAFLLKACAKILSEMPDFNSSLNSTGEKQIYKNYVHIGIAVDTPNGLMVPVIRDVDKKDIWAVSADIIDLSTRARDRKIKPEEMKGGCFTISSLGGISGTYFTPIINPPEVAILGVSRSEMRPVWDGEAFHPQNILPYSLSYDHRIIDGAAAAMFTRRLREILEDESIYKSW